MDFFSPEENFEDDPETEKRIRQIEEEILKKFSIPSNPEPEKKKTGKSEINPALSKSSTFCKLVESLKSIYLNINNSLNNKHQPRYEEVTRRFAKLYGEEPQYFVRVPMKISLLGEHLNSQGYPQLYVNLEQDVVIAFSESPKSELLVSNIQASIYKPLNLPADYSQLKFTSDETQEILELERTPNQESYINHIIAGFKAALGEFKINTSKGAKILISPNITKDSDLSLFPSILCGIGLLSLYLNGVIHKVKPMEIYAALLKYQRILGGGADDIAPILFGSANKAVLVKRDTNDISINDLEGSFCVWELPVDAALIIASSLTPKSTFLSVGDQLSKRLVEIKIAIILIMFKLGMKNYEDVNNLSELQRLLDFSEEDMIDILKENVEDKVYKQKDVEEITGQPLIKSISAIPYSDAVLNNTAREYLPFKRALHILQENLRLKQLKSALEMESNNEDKVKTLMQLVNDSFKSCKDLYDASSEEADKLVDQFMKFQDVYGAKLCGSGWGGSVLVLAKKERVDMIIDGIIKDYYNEKENKLIINDDLDMIIFFSGISGSCCILDPQYEIWF